MNKTLLASLAIVGIAAASQAATVSYSATVPQQTTDFTNIPLSLSQFNPSLGTLTSVTLTLAGTATGSIRFESLDAQAAAILANLTASISASGPAALAITTVPLSSTTTNVTAYDGTIDFGGTSGRTLDPLSATDTQSSSLSSGFGSYVGTNNVTINLSANGNSTVSGSGNIVTNLSQKAGGIATLTYTYTPVPEPATMAVLSIGALGLLRRRRARKS